MLWWLGGRASTKKPFTEVKVVRDLEKRKIIQWQIISCSTDNQIVTMYKAPQEILTDQVLATFIGSEVQNLFKLSIHFNAFMKIHQ